MQFLNGSKCNQESDMNTKLGQLESNLNKLASEQEQVQASMKMIDSLQKLGAEFQQLQKRQEEYENYQIKPKHNNNQQQLSATIKQLESRMIDIDNLLLNCKTLHRRPDILNLELSFKNSLQTVKQEVQQEYKNIYKVYIQFMQEMNGLKCDLDYVINGSVKARITNKIKTQNINLDSNKLLFINLLELETFIEELDRYESDNTERLLLEIKNADQDKLKSLNYQLAGTKRKYLNEIKKIEHKFRILSDLITPSSPQEKYTIQLSCQMNAIVSRLHKNIDTLLLTISEYQLQ